MPRKPAEFSWEKCLTNQTLILRTDLVPLIRSIGFFLTQKIIVRRSRKSRKTTFVCATCKLFLLSFCSEQQTTSCKPHDVLYLDCTVSNLSHEPTCPNVQCIPPTKGTEILENSELLLGYLLKHFFQQKGQGMVERKQVLSFLSSHNIDASQISSSAFSRMICRLRERYASDRVDDYSTIPSILRKYIKTYPKGRAMFQLDS